ncbi:MAG: YggT family protein [Limnochordales bacterium]
MAFELYRLVGLAFEVYTWLLIIRILLTWFPVDPYNPLVQFIARVTDPFLNLFRGLLPPLGAVDISPILAFFALRLLRTLVMSILRQVLFF